MIAVPARSTVFSGAVFAIAIGACGSDGPTAAEQAAAKRAAEEAAGSLKADGGIMNANGCVPKTCPPGANCGLMDDGCGKKIRCGSAPTVDPSGEGPGGREGKNGGDEGDENGFEGDGAECGAASGNEEEGGALGSVCDPKTFRCSPRASACAASGAECGALLDPCGIAFGCGVCSPQEHCDSQNKCVPGPATPPTGCAPLTCTDPTSTSGSGQFCGTISNACGATISCGACPQGETCGGGGVPFRCGTSPECAGKQCGRIVNACGSAVFECGTCAGDQECGADGLCHAEAPPIPEGPCTPTISNACAGKACGSAYDGCSFESCGSCGAGQKCSGDQCVACTPNPNPCSGKECGSVDDGCGNSVACGSCTGSAEFCNGANMCQTCTPNPNPCAGQTCGSAYDGCSDTVTCGTCSSGSCVNGSCCVPSNPCTGVAGVFSDGCGGSVNCAGTGGGGPAVPH